MKFIKSSCLALALALTFAVTGGATEPDTNREANRDCWALRVGYENYSKTRAALGEPNAFRIGDRLAFQDFLGQCVSNRVLPEPLAASFAKENGLRANRIVWVTIKKLSLSFSFANGQILEPPR